MRNRKRLIFLVALVVLVFIAGCQPVTVIVKETVPVVTVVKQTVVVVRTPTATPRIKETPEVTQGPAVRVRLVGWSSSGAAEELRRAHMDECGVTYDAETAFAEYQQKLRMVLAAGEEIDVVYVTSTTFQALAAAGLLTPLDGVPEISLEEFYPPLVDSLRLGRVTYAVPASSSPLVLYFNEDLFEQAGIKTPDNDWSWADLEKAAWAITESTKAYGFYVSDSPSTFGLFVIQNGGQIMTADFRDTLIEQREAVAAARFYTGAHEAGWAAIPEQLDAGSYYEAFGRGEVAMIIAGIGLVSYYRETYPDVNYGAVYPPKGTAAERTWAYATGYAVPVTSSAPKAAVEAIACLTTKDRQIELLAQGDVLPSRLSLEEDPGFPKDPTIRTMYTSAAYASPYYWGPRHSEVYDAIREALLRVYQEGIDVEESLSLAANQIRDTIGD